MNMKGIFTVGDKIGGFCNGCFGRDDYEDKACILVNEYFALFQYENGRGVVLNATEYLPTDKPYNREEKAWNNWVPRDDKNYQY